MLYNTVAELYGFNHVKLRGVTPDELLSKRVKEVKDMFNRSVKSSKWFWTDNGLCIKIILNE